MDDIEDLASSLEQEPQRPARAAVVLPRQRVRPRGTADPSKPIEEPGEHVPGVHSIYVKTFGCAHNVSDSEYMQGSLLAYGYRLVPDKAAADLWLVNSCTVKDPSQSSFMNLVKSAHTEGKKLVVAGCVPQGDRGLKWLEGVSVVGVTQIDRVVEVVEETLRGNSVRLLGRKSLPSLDLPKVRRDPLIEIVPLSTGCLGACTYCKTKHARGVLGSYAADAIVERARQAEAEGVREIWLSSEDTGAYGRDLGTDLPTLLDSLTLHGDDDGVMFRLGMTNPPYILEHLERIAAVMRRPNVFAFLHVPVQSGSDRVLSAMNREYTVAEFERVADTMLEMVPGLTLATDIIAGFPGETEEEFQDTLRLVRKYAFPILNISKFYPRPGTPAAKMKRVPTDVAKDRTRRLTEVFRSNSDPYQYLVGSTLDVWVGSEVASNGAHSVAHTKAYVKVLLPRNDGLVGRRVRVTVESSAKFHVVATLVVDGTAPSRTRDTLRLRRSAPKAAAPSSATDAVPAPLVAVPAAGAAHAATRGDWALQRVLIVLAVTIMLAALLEAAGLLRAEETISSGDIFGVLRNCIHVAGGLWTE